MGVTRVTTLTEVCVDYVSYIKIGPNEKKRSSYCWARQVIFALITTTTTTTTFEALVFEIPPYWKRVTTVTLPTNMRANTHTNPKRRNNEPYSTSMFHIPVVEIALFAKCKPNVGPILGTLQEIYHYYLNNVHTLFKFGNRGYRHRSHISTSTKYN